LNRTYSAFCFN